MIVLRLAWVWGVLGVWGLPPASAFGPQAAVPGPPELRMQRSTASGQVTWLTAAVPGAVLLPAAGNVPADPAGFLAVHGVRFGVTDPATELMPGRVRTDALGGTHSTFDQQHRGIPVFSGRLIVHQNAGGDVYAANGRFHSIPEKLSIQPAISGSQALASARAAFGGAPQVRRVALTIVDPGWYQDPSWGPRLAYQVVLTDPATLASEAFFVEASTAELMDRWPLDHAAKARAIHDGAGTPDVPGTLVRAEGDPPVGDHEVDAAYDYYGDVYDYFANAFGRDGIDDQGLAMVATVNSTAPNCPNAFWSSTLLQMVFCSGTVTDDVVAHELAHGVTQFSADLIYQNQSGQLNESFSDIFGELVDLFNGGASIAGMVGGSPWEPHATGPGLDDPNELRTTCSDVELDYPDGVRWLIGEDATAFGGAIRDLWEPACSGHPNSAFSPLQTCAAGDNGGVHSGSGIPNHAFAMVTDGKSFNGYTVSGIGAIKAAAVWYRALTTYLTPASDFEDAYFAFNQAAADLVGTVPNDPGDGLPAARFTAADAVELDQALQAVELNSAGLCGQGNSVLVSGTQAPCPHRTLVFADDFERGAPGWTVSNSMPPSAYDWVLHSKLPFDRPGSAFFVADPAIGDCDQQDESGSHSLISPPIAVPDDPGVLMLAFTHYLATEGSWDGGNLQLRVNGGDWQTVSRSAFRVNPYNGRLRLDNSNPLAGQPAWTGYGDNTWGTSRVDLSGLAQAGDLLEFRFEFGKDGCAGEVGWYVDDVAVYVCPDCDGDGTADEGEFVFTIASGILEIGETLPATFVVRSPPAAAGDVHLRFTAFADLGGLDELIDVSVNGVAVGQVFASGASDCSPTPDSHGELSIFSGIYNAAVAGGDAEIMLAPTKAVNVQCGGAPYLTAVLRYPLATPDEDGNGVPDTCACPGDLDGNAVVNAADLAALLGAWGPNPGHAADLTGDGLVDAADLAGLLGHWGACVPS